MAHLVPRGDCQCGDGAEQSGKQTLRESRREKEGGRERRQRTKDRELDREKAREAIHTQREKELENFAGETFLLQLFTECFAPVEIKVSFEFANINISAAVLL